MTLIVCYIIAYVQIMAAGYNLWGVDPLILFNMPLGRNTFLVGTFQLTQLLGLVGAILILQKARLGFLLSIVHHVLLMPALLVTSWGMVMLLDDRINLTLLFMSGPNIADVNLFWSLGWETVFKQVTRNVPTGSAFFGINLVAFGCAMALWVGMDEMDAMEAEREMQMRRRQRPQNKRAQLALPPPKSASAPPSRPEAPKPMRQPAPPPRPPQPTRQPSRIPLRSGLRSSR